MISLERCKAILTQHGQKYTDERIKQIRDTLYQLGYLDYEDFKRQQSEAGYTVHAGFDRRPKEARV